MDTQPEEDDVLLAMDPLEVVEHVLAAENLTFDRTEDGEVVFRHALALPAGERPTMAQAASMIDAAVEAADRFYPAFDFLLHGAKNPDEAMAACMFETVGQA